MNNLPFRYGLLLTAAFFSSTLLAKQETKILKQATLIHQETNTVHSKNVKVSEYLNRIERGDNLAMIELGDLFMNDPELKNVEQARYWFTLAEKKGLPEGKFRLRKISK